MTLLSIKFTHKLLVNFILDKNTDNMMYDGSSRKAYYDIKNGENLYSEAKNIEDKVQIAITEAKRVEREYSYLD